MGVKHPVVAVVRAADTDEAKAAAVLRWLTQPGGHWNTGHISVRAALDALADEIDPATKDGK